jgi:pyroglutamyl-peptidase
MAPRVLVTGFLPFGEHAVNPSARLAESCGKPFEILEVSFAAVDDFLLRLASAQLPPDVLLMLGLRGGGIGIDVERIARNHVGTSPDMRGETRGPGPINPGGPDVLPTRLFHGLSLPQRFAPSDDAGCYLCNYVYYQALRRLPLAVRVGFVHVPPLDALPLEEQQRELHDLLQLIEVQPAPNSAYTLAPQKIPLKPLEHP